MMRRQVSGCFQFIEDNDGGWLVVELLHSTSGGTRMSWSFATKEQAEHHLREARSAHVAAYGCGRPPRRRPVGGEIGPVSAPVGAPLPPV